jgi:hypothetical protein
MSSGWHVCVLHISTSALVCRYVANEEPALLDALRTHHVSCNSETCPLSPTVSVDMASNPALVQAAVGRCPAAFPGESIVCRRDGISIDIDGIQQSRRSASTRVCFQLKTHAVLGPISFDDDK